MAAPLLVIAAGGTGGHMFPAQALAEAMLARGWRVTLSTDERGARYAGGFPEAVERQVISSATFARGGTLAKTGVPFKVLAGIGGARRRLKADRPAMVVGFGGYPSIPALAAAWTLRIPRMIHEQNGVLGRVNQIFARRVQKVACGTWPTTLPGGVEAEHTGNPVRAAVRGKAGTPYIPPGDFPMSVLVIGGSQGARILSDVVPPAISALPREIRAHVRVAHQAREEDIERVSKYYAEEGISAEVEPFFSDVPERMSEAQLVISRAGASSVADLTVIGRPGILVPFPHATADHQTANARALGEAGGALVVQEPEFQVDSLSEQIAGILGDPERATSMAQAAAGLGRPDATERLVALVETLAEGRTKE